MANLVVRNIDSDIVKALKERAGQRGVSAEAEHRRILKIALQRPSKKSFAEVLKSIPPVGRDEDFHRIQLGESPDVFD